MEIAQNGMTGAHNQIKRALSQMIRAQNQKT